MGGTGPRTGYVLVLRLELSDTPGTLGRVTTAIGEDGGDIGNIDLVGQFGRKVLREVTVTCRNEAHARELTEKADAVEGVRVLEVGDRTFLAHQGGKLAVVPKLPLKTPDDLSVAYTPGVGRVSQAIAADPERVWDLTVKGNSVAVLTDGTAVLGLGAIGPAAALPVMEGKAALFKEFADIDAYPICVDAAGPEELIAVAKAVAPGFGGINLEDVAAPACFEVEERLRRELDIPVFHDDQHGTAVVVLAALENACRVVGKRLEDLRVVVLGAGAAGIACARLLPARAGRWAGGGPGRHHGPRGDRVRPGQPGARDRARRGPAERGRGRHRAQRLPQPDQQRAGVPRVLPGPAGRPGPQRHRRHEGAAACGLASLVDERELDADFVIPSVFDRRVAPAVSRAVQETVEEAGLSRLVEPR